MNLQPDERFGRSCNPALMQNLGPEGWRALALGELDRAIAAGADTFAGMYHGCQRQLCAFEAERPIAIEHYLTVFARGLGIEFEDTFKKYRLWADPARIFEDSTPASRPMAWTPPAPVTSSRGPSCPSARWRPARPRGLERGFESRRGHELC